MNLVENYLTENGYDYFGNAAEDTLLFFVRDNDAPSAESEPQGDDEAITNLSDNAVNGVENEDANRYSNSDSTPHLATVDNKQTENEPSRFKN